MITIAYIYIYIYIYLYLYIICMNSQMTLLHKIIHQVIYRTSFKGNQHTFYEHSYRTQSKPYQ